MAYDAENFTPAKVDPLTITDPRERLKYLAEFLRGLPPERFDMAAWPVEHRCNSAMCIGGRAEAVFALPQGETCNRVGKPLGLTFQQSYDLFFPEGDWDALTLPDAVATLDHLIATGEVSWSKARA